ncbi:MAG: acyltransferase [Cytophaga sp.]|nr:acyltransferase [Undibacterium sp.]
MENQTSKPDDQHFDYLDGWRGLAIVFLLIGHFFPIPGINFGRVGVDFFFVLSGLLMSRLLFIKKVPIKTFYQRRIARIFPAHFAYLILILCYFLLAGKEINWSETLMAGLFINNYFPGEIGHAVMPFGHIWSLSVEEHTYIGLSLIAIGVRQRLLNVQYTIGILVLISIVFGVSYWYLYTPQKLEYELWGHSEVSAFGILFSAFLLLLFKKIKIPTLPTAFYPALILLGLACYWWSVPLPIRGYIGVGLFAFVVNALPTAPSIVKNILSMRPLKMVGIYSFSIYLWQQVFYLAHHREGLPSSIALLLSLCCGVTSYYLVENPFRRYLNTRWGESMSKASYKN